MHKPAEIVLVVEDEPLIRLFLADALEDAGYAVLEAGSVLEAVGLLGSYPDIGAVFTDVDMPGGLDGTHLARLVGRISRDIGIGVTSGRSNIGKDELPERARFIPKPYTAAQAIHLIDGIMRRSPRLQNSR
jgi:CheY-like chemotaxis protein